MGENCEENRRLSMRFHMAVLIQIESEIDGLVSGVMRNLSSGGLCVEMLDPPPIGTIVNVIIPGENGMEFTREAQVKHNYFFNYYKNNQPLSSRGVGLKFVESVSPEALTKQLTELCVIH